MKITAITSSYRKKGNIAQVLQLLIDSLHRQAALLQIPLEIQTIHLAHHKLEMCRGCRVCFDQGETQCPLKDDLLPIFEQIQTTDAVITASPVYVDDVNGVMKNWIDRMAFVCHRPQFAGKSAFLLATAGTAHSKHALRTMAFALRTWGFNISGKVSLITGALMKKGEINDHFHPKIEKAAEKMLLSLHKTQPIHPSLIALMTFRIQQAFWQKNQDDSVDYQYWHEQGWMEKDCNFYIPHSASANKVFLARLIGQVIGAFVT